jgi:molecular chaperone GrpE
MKDDARPKDKKGNGQEIPFAVIDRRPSFRDDADTPAAGPAEARLPSYVEQLQARTEEAERRAREISAAYRRIDQERDAFRERLNRDLERRVEIARADLMRKVIGVLDDLNRAITAARSATDPATLRDGVAIIRDRLLQVLASEGVEPIETRGRPFDPALAEAVATEEVDDPDQDDTVVEEVEKGYTVRGTLLRPARVKVARARSRDTERSVPSADPSDPPTDPD